MKEEKKEFQKAEVEVVRFENQADIITTSSVGGAGEGMIDETTLKYYAMGVDDGTGIGEGEGYQQRDDVRGD